MLRHRTRERERDIERGAEGEKERKKERKKEREGERDATCPHPDVRGIPVSDVARPGARLTAALEVVEDLEQSLQHTRRTLHPSTEPGLDPWTQRMVQVGVQVSRRHTFSGC